MNCFAAEMLVISNFIMRHRGRISNFLNSADVFKGFAFNSICGSYMKIVKGNIKVAELFEMLPNSALNKETCIAAIGFGMHP